ncbi:TPA: hypothetical protein ACH3X2_001336 [Trebouxia sp. C0005]
MVRKCVACVSWLILLQHVGASFHAEGSSRCPFERHLLQATDDSDDFGDLAEDVSVFQEVAASNYTVSLTNTNSLQVTNLSATIEMDSGATFADNFLIDNRNTWEAGLTRVNVSVAVQAASGSGISTMIVPSSITAQLHDLPCTVGQTFSNSSLYYQTNQTTDANFTIALHNGAGANSTTLPYLVDYDSTQSMVIVNAAGQYIACTAMTPPLPDFPDEWSATVESNIVNKGYTFTMNQYYSLSQNKVRVDLHSNGTDRVLIQDFNASTLTILTEANSTYPHGYCSSQNIPNFVSNRFTDNETSLLLSTAEFLRFNVDRADTVFVPGHVNVRGIPCEEWTQYANVANETGASYNVSFYFPVSQWLTAREDYHRLLTQIALTGMRNGSAVSHFYNYVNFRAETQAEAVFDACALAPKGENCNCTSADLAALASGQQLLAASLDGITIDPDAVECLAAATSSYKGFSHAQAGPYALFTLVGFAIGMMMALAGSFIWTTCSNQNIDQRPSSSSLGGSGGKFQPFDAEVARG